MKIKEYYHFVMITRSTKIQNFWTRIPTLIKAIVTSTIVALTGIIPWSVLTFLNIKIYPIAPLAIPLMLAYLVYYWKYWGGWGWPKSTQDNRRENLRAKPLNRKGWFWSLTFGGLAFCSLFALIAVLQRLISLPNQPSPTNPDYPIITIIGLFLMGNIVTGIVEEAAFRGYMQTPIETSYGLTKAIIVVGIIFGLSHLSHSWVTLRYLPIYFIISAIYGILVHTTDSILPGIVLHSVGNTISGIVIWIRRYNPPSMLLWQTGLDKQFMINLIIGVVAGFLTIVAYFRLKAEIVKSPTLDKI
jgi:uncharacterized protein